MVAKLGDPPAALPADPPTWRWQKRTPMVRVYHEGHAQAAQASISVLRAGGGWAGSDIAAPFGFVPRLLENPKRATFVDAVTRVVVGLYDPPVVAAAKTRVGLGDSPGVVGNCALCKAEQACDLGLRAAFR